MMELTSRNTPDAEMNAFLEDLHQHGMSAYWETRGESSQRPRALPTLWRWREIEPFVIRAGQVVGTGETERRVLHLNNAAGRQNFAPAMLSANIQIVLPGEIARAHRHTMAALRVVIEGSGGYTVVNGEAVPMTPGDLVLTPNWTWHDHANDSQEPMVWIDGLDASIVAAIAQALQEDYPEVTQPAGEETDISFKRYGGGSFRPAWGERAVLGHSPQMHYPWQQAKSVLDAMATGTDSGSAYDGLIVEYTDPLTGGPVMPTIGCYAQILRPGKHTTAHRHMDSTIYHVVEGQGFSIVDGQRLDWEAKDIFAVPSWLFHEHVNTSPNQPAYLFSYTNRPAVEALHLYREEAAP